MRVQGVFENGLVVLYLLEGPGAFCPSAGFSLCRLDEKQQVNAVPLS